jgi:hypothetical protein
MSFSKQPTNEQIEHVLELLQTGIGELTHRDTLCVEVYGSIDPISDRLVRLCITALQEKGYLVFASNGYMLASDDPEPVIHYLNGLYSRANKLIKKADNMFHELKRKYGDEVAKKVEQLPGQPMIPYRKEYDREGNEIDVT